MHDALVYQSDAQFVEALTPFILGGLDRGEEICAVTRRRNCELLRESLGDRADEVRFVDAMEWYRSPAQTIAAYHGVILDALSSGAPGLRVVGEVEFADTLLEHAEWTRYESVLNIAFQDTPAWITCPYDARRLPESIVADARRTHPNVVDDGERYRTGEFADPTTFVAALPVAKPERLLDDLKPNSPGDLRSVRQLVRHTSAQVGLSADRAEELCIAVVEVTTNAIEHGRAPARVRAWSSEHTLVYEVTDGGCGPIDSFVGFIPPQRLQPRGRGLWISRQLTDRLEIASTSAGTAVFIEVALAS